MRHRLDLHIGDGIPCLFRGVIDVDGIGKNGLMGPPGATPTRLEVPDCRLDPPGSVNTVKRVKTRPVHRTEILVGDMIGSRKHGYPTLAGVVRVGKRQIRSRD